MILNTKSDFEFFKNEWFGKDLPYLYVRIVKSPKKKVFFMTSSNGADEVPSLPVISPPLKFNAAKALKIAEKKAKKAAKLVEEFWREETEKKSPSIKVLMDKVNELENLTEKVDANAENEVSVVAVNGLYQFHQILKHSRKELEFIFKFFS